MQLRQSSLERHEYVYVWVDGVHFNIRLEDDRLCTLVMIGVRPNGEKELLAVEDGYRESAESWKTLLGDLNRRGLAAPVVAVGDGALGFWAALREVWPETRVPEGGRVAGYQLGPVTHFLRFSRRALEAPAHHQRHRVDVRHGAAARTSDQRRGIEDHGTADGVQATRHGPTPLATPRRCPPVAAGPHRCEVRGRSSCASTEKGY